MTIMKVLLSYIVNNFMPTNYVILYDAPYDYQARLTLFDVSCGDNSHPLALNTRQSPLITSAVGIV